MTYARAYTLLESHHVDHVTVSVHPVTGMAWNCEIYGVAQLEYLAAHADGATITLIEETS